MFFFVAREDDTLRGQLARFAPTVFASSIVLLVASQFDGRTQTALWALALGADYLGTALGGASGWRLPSPGHFSERHGLILIIALGESIVAIGVGVAELPISWPILAPASLGLVLASAMWWAYFDVSALLGEARCASAPETTRPRLGRNAYTFAHMPMIVGIVLTALGLKKVLEYVGDTEDHELSDPLTGVALGAWSAGWRSTCRPRRCSSGSSSTRSPSSGWRPPGCCWRCGSAGDGCRRWASWASSPGSWSSSLIVESIVFRDRRRKIREELAHH